MNPLIDDTNQLWDSKTLKMMVTTFGVWNTSTVRLIVIYVWTCWLVWARRVSAVCVSSLDNHDKMVSCWQSKLLYPKSASIPFMNDAFNMHQLHASAHIPSRRKRHRFAINRTNKFHDSITIVLFHSHNRLQW